MACICCFLSVCLSVSKIVNNISPKIIIINIFWKSWLVYVVFCQSVCVKDRKQHVAKKKKKKKNEKKKENILSNNGGTNRIILPIHLLLFVIRTEYEQ